MELLANKEDSACKRSVNQNLNDYYFFQSWVFQKSKSEKDCLNMEKWLFIFWCFSFWALDKLRRIILSVTPTLREVKGFDSDLRFQRIENLKRGRASCHLLNRPCCHVFSFSNPNNHSNWIVYLQNRDQIKNSWFPSERRAGRIIWFTLHYGAKSTNAER